LASPTGSTPGAAAGALPGSLPGQIDGPDENNLIADESMITINNVEGQLRASSVRRVAELVDKHPDETLAIMRGWMQAEEDRL
jgi:flagellar M-ring protein FliF